MSAIIRSKAPLKSQRTDDNKWPPSSIDDLLPITSMNKTLPPSAASLVSIASSMPNDAPSPWPKMMSAPAAISAVVTRFAPAASE